MDIVRARQILNSKETIEVLYDGAPVWINNVGDNNSARVTFLNNKKSTEAPVYKLVEVNPANKQD